MSKMVSMRKSKVEKKLALSLFTTLVRLDLKQREMISESRFSDLNGKLAANDLIA